MSGSFAFSRMLIPAVTGLLRGSSFFSFYLSLSFIRSTLKCADIRGYELLSGSDASNGFV